MLMFFVCIVFVVSVAAKYRPSEEERVHLWHEKGNVWPPNWQEETPKMKKVLDEREKLILNIPYGAERWENWLQFTQNRLVPKFTPMGFKVVKIPDNVFKKLSDELNKHLVNYDSLPYEGKVDVIYSSPEERPKFVNMWETVRDAHHELLPLHEEWSGLKLFPTSAYGVRLYQNGSSLVMHYDRVETHVISSICHLAHAYDSDERPWPIEIEDHDGALHSVSLNVGEMLFYESAKALHGRRTEFRGKYYGSVFMHYQPVDKNIWNFSHDDVIASVPPHWREGVKMVNSQGPRYAGACISVPGREAAGAPPLKIEQDVPPSNSAVQEL